MDLCPAEGLEFGAPVLSHEQVLRLLECTHGGFHEYFRLLAEGYDRAQLLQYVDSLCAALLTVAGERHNITRQDG